MYEAGACLQLVLINISDHSTRVHANNPVDGERTRVLGCLLGQQSGRVVDISNSLEIKYVTGEHGIVIDEAYLAKKQEQCTRPRVVRHVLTLSITVYGGPTFQRAWPCRQADLLRPGCGWLVFHRLGGHGLGHGHSQAGKDCRSTPFVARMVDMGWYKSKLPIC